MPDDQKPRLTRSRLFLLIFFGIAIALSITTILGTWEEQREGVVAPAAVTPSLTAPAK